MNLFELTTLEGVAEPIYAASIDIPLILVSRSIYLVKVPKGKPFHPACGFLRHQLGEEVIFSRGRGWTIDGGNFETLIGVTVEDGGGEAKLGSEDVGNLDQGFIPKHKDASAGANGRPLGKASQAVSTEVASRELINVLELRLLKAHNVARSSGNHLMDRGLPVRVV
jgi:hypothetical protein